MLGALADLLVFVVFAVFLEALCLAGVRGWLGPGALVLAVGAFVLFLALFSKLDKIEASLSEEKRERLRAFRDHRGKLAAAGLTLTAILGGLVYLAFDAPPFRGTATPPAPVASAAADARAAAPPADSRPPLADVHPLEKTQ